MSKTDIQNTRLKPEPEHKGSSWLHPYALYVALTVVLFGILLFLGWIAKNNDWIPSR